MTPGFVDTNVHVSLYGAQFNDRKENAVFFYERGAEIALEAAQMHLKHGVTHVRDSYGQLPHLKEVRDAISGVLCRCTGYVGVAQIRSPSP